MSTAHASLSAHPRITDATTVRRVDEVCYAVHTPHLMSLNVRAAVAGRG